MKVIQKLNVGAKDFFDALAASVAFDITQATGNTVNPHQLYSGLCYQKKLKNKIGQETSVDVVIRQFVSPRCYEAGFCTAHGTNVIIYEIEDSKDGNIMVHYREEFEGESSTYSLNHKIVSWFYQKKAKKRISRMLSSMASFIREQAANQEDTAAGLIDCCPQKQK